jgi:2-dehydro-3-deoxyphosphogluconate aldolase/(4S)-4-hydroxy-2-oxoglutarate aldolase
MRSTAELMSSSPVMAIFRSYGPEDAVALAGKAWDLGIELVEVPVQLPSAFPALDAVVSAGRERGKPVGAGTVTTVEQLREVQQRGVAFTVAPGLDADIVQTSDRMNLPHLAGVSTPTEIQQALRLGQTWLKAFPASVLGTQWFHAMRGPFPQVSFVATGGIDAGNARQYLDAGAKTVAVGSALSDPSQIELLSTLLTDRS